MEKAEAFIDKLVDDVCSKTASDAAIAMSAAPSLLAGFRTLLQSKISLSSIITAISDFCRAPISTQLAEHSPRRRFVMT